MESTNPGATRPAPTSGASTRSRIQAGGCGTSTRTPPATLESGSDSCSRVHMYLQVVAAGGVEGAGRCAAGDSQMGSKGVQQWPAIRAPLPIPTGNQRQQRRSTRGSPGTEKILGAFQRAAAGHRPVVTSVWQQSSPGLGVHTVCSSKADGSGQGRTVSHQGQKAGCMLPASSSMASHSRTSTAGGRQQAAGGRQQWSLPDASSMARSSASLNS